MSQHLRLARVNGSVERPVRCLLTGAQWRSIAAALHLSARESQIVRSIFDGRKDTAIAQELGISAHTVHAHLRRIYRKLSVGGRCELIIRIFEAYLSLESAGSSTVPGFAHKP